VVARGLNFDQANEGIGETGLVRDVFAGADGLLILFLSAGEIALLVRTSPKLTSVMEPANVVVTYGDGFASASLRVGSRE